MNRIFNLIYLLLFSIVVSAQPEYPTAPPTASNLVRLEYFVDIDPGFGNGTRIDLPVGQDISSFSLDADLSGIANGYHRIYTRSLDANGKWSFTINSYFDNVVIRPYPTAPAPPAPIVEMEYFIDVDPGPGNGVKINTAALQDIVNQVIVVNVSGLPPGVHQLFLRTKDGDGKWSLTHVTLFDNSLSLPYPVAPAAAPPIGEIEFYIDNDPGFGNGTPVTLTASTEIANLDISVPVTGLTAGEHTIFIRSRQNPWSVSAYATFMYGSTLPVTWLYVKGQMHGSEALINWATATETASKEFVIEHSVDGITYSDIGKVYAAGTTGESRSYSFMHKQTAHGFNYYRLRQIDIDGKFTYSKTIALVNNIMQSETIVGPNPARDMLHVIEPSEVLVKQYEIYDLSGRRVMLKSINTKTKLISIPTGGLPHGTYVVRMVYGNRAATFKFIKN